MVIGGRWLLCLVAGSVATVLNGAERISLVWPTPNPAYAAGKPLEEYVQPTISGRVESGLFGCVRNGGSRFHEGVDLKPIARDGRGEALDPVFSVMEGVVVHVNREAAKSSYGRYVVIEHRRAVPAVVTLYAHLGAIPEAVRPGLAVRAGETIGRMGRSARGNHIPKDRSHLHFEIGLWLSEDFQSWYDWKRFGSPNDHGVMNGMNIIGLDPIDFCNRYRTGAVTDFQSYLNQLQTACTIRVASEGVPDFVRRYPSLFQGKLPAGGVAGWEIDFTSFGLPVRWRALAAGDSALKDAGRGKVVFHHPTVVEQHGCRDLLRRSRGEMVPGNDMNQVLELIFGFR